MKDLYIRIKTAGTSDSQEETQSLSELMRCILMDLRKIEKFEGDYNDAPSIVLDLVRTFAADIITHLSRKVETIRPGYSDRLLVLIDDMITQKNSTKTGAVGKLTPADYLEKSVSGIVSDDLAASVSFLTDKIVTGINAGFEELPILSRNETTLMCSLGIIVAQMYKEYDHKDLDNFVNKFSAVVRNFITNGQDSDST